MYCRPVVSVGTLSSRCATIAPSLLPSQYGRGLTALSSRANRRSTTCAPVSVAVALYVHTWADTQINIIFARPPLPPECHVLLIMLCFEVAIVTSTKHSRPLTPFTSSDWRGEGLLQLPCYEENHIVLSLLCKAFWGVQETKGPIPATFVNQLTSMDKFEAGANFYY